MNDSRSNRKRGRRKKIRWGRISFLVLLILLLCGGAYFYNVYRNVTQAANEMYKPLAGNLSAAEASKKLKNLEPISILLLGDDHRAVGEPGDNSDSMIVVTLNPKTNSMKMLSIPRDSRTKLIDNTDPSKDTVDKINAALSIGGPEMAIDTVENFLNIPIDYYVDINFQGFQDVVNAVGGIDVDNKYPFSLDGVTLQAGPQHLNGRQALEYARMRHQDPRGDFGRQDRQREVISKIIAKGESMSTLTNYNNILKGIANNVTTDLSFDDMVKVLSSYRNASKKIDNMSVEGQGATVDYVWCLLVADSERQTLSDQLRASLNLAPSPVTPFYKGTGIINNYSSTPMTASELDEQP